MGLIILGVTGAFITIPAIVDFMDTLKEKFKIEENAANDMSSALFNFGIYVGETIGPILGGSITNFKGFESTCYHISLINLSYVLIYYVLNRDNVKRYYISNNDDDKEVGLITERKRTLSCIENVAVGGRIRTYSVNSCKVKIL